MTSTGYRHVSVRFLLVIALLAMSTAFWFLERSTLSWGFNWHYALAVILAIWYLCVLFRNNRAAVFTSFFQIYYSLGMLASAVIVSSGAPMIEIDQLGSPNGFFWLMLGFFIIGMEASVLGFRSGRSIRFGDEALRLPTVMETTIALLLMLPSILLAIYVFIRTGGPVLTGVDRVTFWRENAPAGTTMVPTLIAQSFFFVAFLYLWRRRLAENMLLPWLVVIIYVLIGIFVLGEKFSLFIVFLNSWFLVLPGVFPDFRFRAKHLIWVVVMVILLLISLAVSYLLQDREAMFIFVRAALQSQLLWSVVEDPAGLSLLPQRPECYLGCGWLSDGPDYISFRYLPESLYSFYNQAGTRLSGFFPALSLLTFGLIASVLLHLVICFFLGVLQRKISDSVGRGQSLYGFLLFKLHAGVALFWLGGRQDTVQGLVLAIGAVLLYRFICEAHRNIGRPVQQGV
jgi:hypothetical protein